MEKIIVTSKTFWQLIQGHKLGMLSIGNSDVKGFFDGKEVYIDNTVDDTEFIRYFIKHYETNQ